MFKKFQQKIILGSTLTLSSIPALAADSPTEKEWTFLLFINGKNNLDEFGYLNINQMESIGSTEDINLVVQWASSTRPSVDRLLVKKDDDREQVSSPIVQSLGSVDMGDWNNLVEFAKWGTTNYPAKKYFIAVWNHGSGWRFQQGRGPIQIQDISYDDETGNAITTKQLGQAMRSISAHIGRPVDLYGSDACLMSMIEVGGEISDSTSAMVSSQELEPGYGWPYDDFVKSWVANPTANGVQVGEFLTKAFHAAYSGGQYGQEDTTLSTIDLTKLNALNSSIKSLVQHFKTRNNGDLIGRVGQAASRAQSFYFRDYVDLGDFLKEVSAQVPELSNQVKEVQDRLNESVSLSLNSKEYERATGLSIWIPPYRSELDSYKDRYVGLRFQTETQWLDLLSDIVQ